MSNIIDTLKGYVTPDFLSQASSRLGESKSNISSAMTASFPSILSGLMHKSSDSTSMSGMLDMFKNHNHANSRFLDNPSEIFSGDGSILDKGKNFVSSLFGSKSDDVSEEVGKSSGVKKSSAGSIMAMAAPIVMGFLGKKASSNNWGTSDMVGYLKGQKDHIEDAEPNGVHHVIEDKHESRTATDTRTTGHSTPWIKYLLIAAAAIFLLFMVNRSCTKQANVENRNYNPAPVDNPNKFTPNNSLEGVESPINFQQIFQN